MTQNSFILKYNNFIKETRLYSLSLYLSFSVLIYLRRKTIYNNFYFYGSSSPDMKLKFLNKHCKTDLEITQVA